MKPLYDAMLNPDLFGRTFGGAPTRPFIEDYPEVHPVREAVCKLR
jgi:hypothetical protein